MDKRILITGASGQLGSDLSNLLKDNYTVFSFNSNELDVANQKQVGKIFNEIKPDIVIHSGAYTSVDLAETEIEKAFKINAFGTRNVAIESNRWKSKLVYISTDYVFDGTCKNPINEFTPVSPINVYGKSKLEGENFVKDFSDLYYIVRTSWVFGSNGKNFIKTMLKLSESKKEINVVNDQFGSPTYTKDLVAVIYDLINSESYGTYHVSNTGSCSWFELANYIFEQTCKDIKVNAVPSSDFPQVAKRPNYSVLDHMSLRLNNVNPPRHWKEAVRDFLKNEIYNR